MKYKLKLKKDEMKIRRFYFTKESDWVRNVRREDSDGPWCRYEDVEPLLERIKVLEKQKQVLENQVRDLALELKECCEWI